MMYRSEGIEQTQEFDYIVLAFPIHEKAAAMPQVDKELAKHMPKKVRYSQVDFTHFRGDLASKEFRLPNGECPDI